jgi:hypothetical protein
MKPPSSSATDYGTIAASVLIYPCSYISQSMTAAIGHLKLAEFDGRHLDTYEDHIITQQKYTDLL